MIVVKALYFGWVLAYASSSNHLKSSEGRSSSKEIAALSNFEQPHLDNNFENQTLEPWSDSSENGTEWMIACTFSCTNDTNMIQDIPFPPTGGHYVLQLKYDLKSFDVGILSSPIFLAYPRDEIKFFYFIRSEYSHFNNIEVFWSDPCQRVDKKLVDLFPVPNKAEKAKWRTVSVRIPIAEPTEGKIIFYGFRHPLNDADVIAIDDISFIRRETPIITTREPDPTSKSAFTITGEVSNSMSSYSTWNTMTKETIITTSPITADMTTEVVLSSTTIDPYQCDPEIDYSPCICSKFNMIEPHFNCSLVPMIDIRDGVFSRLYSNYYLGFLDLTPLADDIIPNNFLGISVERLNWFYLRCDSVNGLLEVNASAFENNITTTQFNNLVTYNCNFANLSFLSGMQHLDQLYFENSSNLYDILKSIPSEFQLDLLIITKCNLLDLITEFAPLSRGLIELKVYENEKMNDVTIDLFLEWMLATSINLLKKIYVYNNGLTRFPSTELWRFKKLSFFRIDGNILQSGILKRGSLRFTAPVLAIMLDNCGINTIEPGTFEGDYMYAAVYLRGNNLTKFESAVFQPVLEQQALVGVDNGGFFLLSTNPFDCTTDPCHLTWLLRENNRMFLPFVSEAACADGRNFENIQPDDAMFLNCP